jgi:hypothetical protein
MRTIISQLRSSYRDQIHPLKNLRISYPGMLIKMEYLAENSDGEGGVFRIHPRLSQIEIWPDIGSATATQEKQLHNEEEMLEQIHRKTSLKNARESIMKAHKKSRPPNRDDLAIIRGTRIGPEKTRRLMRDEKRRVITLREIEDALKSVQRETDGSRSAHEKYLEITLRSDAPVKLARYSPVKLFVEFI